MESKKTSRFYFRIIIYSDTIVDRRLALSVDATDTHDARRKILDRYLSQGFFIRRFW